MTTSRQSGLFNLLAASGVIFAGTAYSAAPDKNSDQWLTMAPYVEFVKNMTTADGRSSCCDVSDGRVNLQEKSTLNAKGEGYYRVHVTREAYGPGVDAYIPPEGKWVDVDPDAVLTAEHAKAVCDKMKVSDPARGESCNPPPFNLLWYNASNNRVYCYWPIPKNAALPAPTRMAALQP